MNWIPLLCLLIFSLSIVAQNTPKATLLDTIEKSSCEDYMARSDYLAIELQKSASSRGVLVWYGDGGEDGRLADINAKFMHRTLINKYGNSLRVTVLRSTGKAKLYAEAWIVPDGVEFQIPKSTVVAEIPFKVTKRTLYAESDPGPCSNYDNYGFADVLLTNPNLTGVLVAVSWNQLDQADYAADILKRFRELKVPRNRIRIFFKQVKRTPSTELGYWEMWLVPSKKQ